jgi:hypothetical protein
VPTFVESRYSQATEPPAGEVPELWHCTQLPLYCAHDSTKEALVNEELNNRIVVILPGSAGGLRGPARSIALTAEAKALADAIVARLDRIDMWELDGALVLLAGGELHNVNGVVLREILRANFATKHLVTAGVGLSVEYRPVEVSELVMRTLLTAPPADGGLLGRVPAVTMEAPRQAAVEEAMVITDPVEHAAGQAALMKHAGAGGQRLREELEAGRQALAKFRTSSADRESGRISGLCRRRCDPQVMPISWAISRKLPPGRPANKA